MRRSFPPVLGLALWLAACGAASDGTDDGALPDAIVDPGADAVQADPGLSEDPGSGPDALGDEAMPRDAEPDGDVPSDAVAVDPGPPDPASSFWVRERATCVPDGPWPIDTVVQYRTTDVLPDLDARVAAAGADGTAWAGTASGVARKGVQDAAFAAVAGLPGDGAVTGLAARADGGVRVARGAWVGLLDAGGGVTGGFDAGAAVARVADCDGDGYAVSGGRVLRIGADALAPLFHEAPGTVHDVACVGSIPWVATDQGLFRLDDGGWAAAWSPQAPVTIVAAGGGRVAATTGEAVAVVAADGTAVATLAPGPGGLPTGSVRALALSDDGGTLAAGHAIGATRIALDGPRVEHFVSRRWLPDDAATSVFLAPDGALWVATTAGMAALRVVPTTLADKAERMLERMEWFRRLDGFISPWARFPDPWTDAPLPRWDDDNDGQWTQEAVGALCYAYAATGDERYYQAARRSVTNMTMLVDVPSADFEAAGLGRGFVTRSFVRDDEGAVFDGKATQSNWHRTTYTDGHDYYWKDDTSSDEVTGHLFGFSLYHDLCAKDDAERVWVAERLGALAGYILDHGFTLPDIDGEPTTHGDWRPERLAIAVDGVEACVDAGHDFVMCIDAYAGGGFLDSTELLALMLSAWHVTGDVRFWIAYDALVRVHRYDRVATFHDQVATWAFPATANYCDHELADLAFLTLIRYEPDPVRRTHWIDQVLASFQYEVGERNPLKSLVIAAVQDAVPGLDAGVSTLVDYPEDLREWRVDNGHRVDYRRNVADRFQEPQFREAPPYDEITIKRWDHNPYRVADGGSGDVRMAPTFWLLPYWGLRYHNAICAPAGG